MIVSIRERLAMNRNNIMRLRVLVIATAMFRPGACYASREWEPVRPADATNVRVTVELTDGSRLVGQPTITELPMESALGGVEVPWGQLDSLKRDPNRDALTLLFRNGDKLQATLKLQSLQLASRFGGISIP